MSLEIFRLVGNVLLDTSEALTGLGNVENRAIRAADVLKKSGESITAFGKKMTMFATLPIIAGLAGAVKASSDLNETLSKTEVVFQDGTKEVLDWSNQTLKSIGLAKITALDMAAVYGDMGTGMGLTRTEAKKMAMSMVDLTGDMASFKNMRPDEIHIALAGAYTGETEALKRLGVVMTVANLEAFALEKGIKKNYKAMTQAERIGLRYEFIMDSANNSIGDFARTQDSAANQSRIFTESLKEIATNIGDILLPYFTNAITFVNKLVDKFRLLPPSVQKVNIIIALLVSLIGPLTMGLGFVVSAGGSVIGFFAALTLPVAGAVAGITIFTGVLVGSGVTMLAAAKKAGVLKKAITFLKDVFMIFKEALTGRFMSAVDLVQEKFGVSRLEAIKFITKITELKETFLIFADKLKTKGREAFQTLIDYTIKVSKYLYMHRSDILKTIGTILNFSKKFIKATSDILKTSYKIVKWGQDVGKTLMSTTEKVGKMINDIKFKFAKFAINMWIWGQNAMRMFTGGFAREINALVDKARYAAKRIKDFMGFESPTKEGPGKTSNKWSINFMNMYIKGIASKLPELQQIMLKMAEKLKITDNLDFGITGNLAYANNNGSGSAGKQNIVNVTFNNPVVSSSDQVNETMEKVQEKLEDWLSDRQG